MDHKGHKMDQKGLKYVKKRFFGPKIPVFAQFFWLNFWYPLPPKQKLVCQTKFAALGVTICIWKNPDTFEIIRQFGSHLEKSGQFRNHPENWQSSGKIRTVLK